MPEGNEGLGFKAALTPELQNHEYITPFKEVKDLAADYVTVKAAHNDLSTKYAEAGNKLTDYEGRMKNAAFIPGADAKPEDIQAFENQINGYVKEKMINGKYIPVLKEGATEQEFNDFLKALGRPETPDGYVLPEFKIPDNIQLTPQQTEAFKVNVPQLQTWAKQVFHAAGVPPAMATTLFNAYMDVALKGDQAKAVKQAQELQSAQESLRSEWGDKYDTNMAATKKEVERAEKVIPGFKAYMEESGLGNNPMLVKLFNEYARSVSDDAFLKGSASAHVQHEPGRLKYKTMEESQ